MQPVDQLPSLRDNLSRNFNFRRNAGQNRETGAFFIVSLQWSTPRSRASILLPPFPVSSCKKLTKTVLAIVAHRWRKKNRLFARRDAFCTFPESCLFLSPSRQSTSTFCVSAYLYALYTCVFTILKVELFAKKTEKFGIRLVDVNLSKRYRFLSFLRYFPLIFKLENSKVAVFLKALH